MHLQEVEQQLEFLVERAPQADAAAIVAAVTRLDTLAREHGAELPPGLLHYLHGHSYQKALQYLRGQRPGHRSCGR